MYRSRAAGANDFGLLRARKFFGEFGQKKLPARLQIGQILSSRQEKRTFSRRHRPILSYAHFERQNSFHD